jgi:hypothetical protein
VAGREFERIGVAEGDVIYLNRGRAQGIQAGMDFAVIRDRRGVVHPVTEGDLGRIIHRLGRARVLCAQENTATAVLVETCEPVHDSDEVVPWVDASVPAVFATPPFDRCLEPSGGRQGYVVSIKDDVDAGGTGHILHADLGAGSGIQPGDFLTIYRDRGELPRTVIGQALVLTVESGTCTAKVTKTVREFGVGDRVEVVQ